METVNLLNVGLHNISQSRLLASLEAGGVVFTPNLDHLSKLQTDASFFAAYQEATYRICDSQILYLFSRWLGTPIVEKISGSDLLPAFCEFYRDRPEIKLFLLGGAPGVAAIARERINEKTGREMVVAAHSPSFGFENDPEECQEIVNIINSSSANALAVGLGAPKQEIWIHRHKHQLENIKIFLAVGAAIDFESGNRDRAPKWMSHVGLEWLHRLLLEPKRLWKRYFIDDLPVLWLLCLQKLGMYRPPQFDLMPTAEDKSLIPVYYQLEQAGLISARELEAALKLQQQQRHLSLGEILVRQGWLSRQTVDFFSQKLSRSPQEPLHECFRQAGLLDSDRFASIMQQQQSSGESFEEIALNRGWLKQQTVDFFREWYGHRGCEPKLLEVRRSIHRS